MKYLDFAVALLKAAVGLVKPIKELKDAAYAAKFGMSHEEAVRRHDDMERRNVRRPK